MRWVLQSNLGSTAELDRLRRAVRNDGAELVEVRVVPFSDELPDVPNDVPTVFYGATSFVARVHAAKRWTPGVYFDEEGFDLRTWTAALGGDALNHGARVVGQETTISWASHLGTSRTHRGRTRNRRSTSRFPFGARDLDAKRQEVGMKRSLCGIYVV